MNLGGAIREHGQVMTPTRNPRWPNFFIGGAPRSGTTTLYESLKRHPDIFLSEIKEPLFFADVDSQPIIKVVKDEAEYLALFADGAGAKILGEASTGYLEDKSAYRRIKAKSPDAKWVFVLRDPVERAYSHYRLDFATGVEHNDSFWDVLNSEVSALPEHRPDGNSYIRLGFYGNQLPKFFDTFGKEQVRVYLQDDLRNERAVIEDICQFLEVPFGDGAFYEPEQVVNAATQPRSRAALAILRSTKLRSVARCSCRRV